MAFILINIQPKLAVVNGFVEIPDKPQYRNKVTIAAALILIPGSTRKRQALHPHQIIDQEWLELPAYDKASGPASDYYQTLRTYAASL